MSGVWVGIAGVARLAAVSAVMLACPAIAEDAAKPTDAVTPEDGETETRSALSTVMFGSLEAGPTKTFIALGMKTAYFGGLATSGFRTLMKVGGAQEQARQQRPHGIAYKSEAQALIGYEWRIGDSFLSLYAGSDYEGQQREEPLGTVASNRYGARIQGDLWMTPTATTMLQASAYASTLDRRLWGRVAPGWMVPGSMVQGSVALASVYVGPEIEAYRSGDYTKLRLGLHLTGLRLFGVTWRVSGGWQNTSDRPSEAYATLGLHWQR